MTVRNKQDLIKSLTEVLEAIIVVEEPPSKVNSKDDTTVEMLTIKECSKIFKGVSEHAILQLVTQGKIPTSVLGKVNVEKFSLTKSSF